MRILHILDHSIPLHSGYTFRTRSILREQRALGWTTFHLTGAKQGIGPTAEETVDGLQFFRTPATGGTLSGWPVLNQKAVIDGLARRLEQILPTLRPDILHAHSPSLNALAALRARKRFGIPVVYEVRAFWEDAAVDHGTSRENGLRYRLTRALETHVLKQADAVTTICEGLRRDIEGRGIPEHKITVIPNAVDIDRFGRKSPPDAALLDGLQLRGRSVIGFIGSFYAYEGLELLLQAAPAMLAKVPELRILLVGGGARESALRRLASDLGIADKVIFTGRVPHDQVERYYDLIDVLVYPRLSMRLTELVTPLKPLEAMAQGRLVAASDVGGHRELVIDGETGTLFEAGSAQALAHKVCELLQARERWPAMRAAGRRFVETERNWARSVGRYRDVYARIAQQRAA